MKTHICSPSNSRVAILTAVAGMILFIGGWRVSGISANCSTNHNYDAELAEWGAQGWWVEDLGDQEGEIMPLQMFAYVVVQDSDSDQCCECEDQDVIDNCLGAYLIAVCYDITCGFNTEFCGSWWTGAREQEFRDEMASTLPCPGVNWNASGDTRTTPGCILEGESFPPSGVFKTRCATTTVEIRTIEYEWDFQQIIVTGFAQAFDSSGDWMAQTHREWCEGVGKTGNEIQLLGGASLPEPVLYSIEYNCTNAKCVGPGFDPENFFDNCPGSTGGPGM